MKLVNAFVKFHKVKMDRVGVFEIFQRLGCSKFGTINECFFYIPFLKNRYGN
jgi:hypothetical protein